MSQRQGRPTARHGDVVVKAVADEVLVYDLSRHRAHSLNAVAAAVWRRCDGTRDLAAIAADVRRTDGIPMTPEAVHYALAELGRARLLLAPVAEARLTRRDLVKRLGTAAAVALPIVTSIMVPTSAQAQSQPQSCVPPNIVNAVCETQNQCCQPAVCQITSFSGGLTVCCRAAGSPCDLANPGACCSGACTSASGCG